MTTNYRKYISHIKDEANGALDYARKSMMFKKTRPQFAAWYAEMAADELKHAGYLTNIGQAMMDENKASDTVVKAWEDTLEELAEITAKVNAMTTKSTM